MQLNNSSMAGNAARRCSFGLVNNSISSKEDRMNPRHKSMVAGSFLETFEFQIPVDRNPRPIKIRIRKPPELCTEEYLKELAEASDHRAISRIRSLICGNFDMEFVKFITLTFAPDLPFNTQNLKICNEKKKTFIKKVQKIYGNFKYLIVPEYQQRGAVHYHIIADLPILGLQWLEKTWGYGRTQIRAWQNKRDIDSYHYLTKSLTRYVSKTFKNHEFKGLRRFYASNNLIKPQVYYGQESVTLNNHCDNLGMVPIDDYEFSIPYQGYVRYRSFRVKKHITLGDQDLIMGYVPEAYEK